MRIFKRKPRNRRVGQERVLDVKLRSAQVRASRLRFLALAMILLFTTILGLYLIWRSGQWALNRLIYENDAFAIKTIDVETDGVMAIDQLRRWSGVKVGENLMALDLGRVKRDLEMVSLIRSVAVERILPHKLRLRVMEREPLAEALIYQTAVRSNAAPEMNQFLLLDRESFVIQPVDPRQRAVPAEANEVLPVITGIAPAQLIPGHQLGIPQAQAALDMIEAFNRSPMSGLVDLQRVDISLPGVVVVSTAQGSEITFAIASGEAPARAHEFDRELRRWHSVFDFFQKSGKAIASLDLSVPANIPAHAVDAGLTPPAPRNRNAQHRQKKNV